MFEITVLLKFQSPSLVEGQRLWKALDHAARGMAQESHFVSSSFSAPVDSMEEPEDGED